MYARRHGWQRPLHPLQMVGMAVYSFLVASFYCFLGRFLGNPIAEIVVISVFSSVALSVMVVFIRCTATDPSAKDMHNQKKRRVKSNTISKAKKLTKLNYGFIMKQMIMRGFRRMERKILKTCIRRKYLLDPRITHENVHLDPLLPFPLPLVSKEDDASVTPDLDSNDKEEEFSFCSLCNFHVKKRSKHCRTCNRCVEGFDHHCRWLNNCVGKKNYTTFIILMISVLLMLVIEGGTAIAVFIRCFAYKENMEQELARNLHSKFPRGLLAAISVVLLLLTAYGSAALGQLFFFHVVLIRKGMRTYDYILAMREANRFSALDPLNDSEYSSDDSSEPSSPVKPTVLSQIMCKGQRKNLSPGQLSVKIDPESGTSMVNQNQHFRASLDPWKLIEMSKEKALKAAEKAIEKQKIEQEVINPLPFEQKSGPLAKPERDQNNTGLLMTPIIPKARLPGSPGRFSSPRRRFSGSPATLPDTAVVQNQIYKSKFDLSLTGVSRELEGYTSKQVLCSIVKDGAEASPTPR